MSFARTIASAAAAPSAGVAAALLLALPAGGTAAAQPAHASHTAASTDGASAAHGHLRGCRPQRAQAFLKRSSYVIAGILRPEPSLRAIRYRTERYGYVDGFGSPAWNSHSPGDFVRETTFMDLSVHMHEKVVPVLACVEDEVRRACTRSPYDAKALSGFRERNTFRGAEVTNHLYGIAIDIDPDRNPCCGCVEPWRSHPACQKKATAQERAAIPACWVHAFEKYGFYWLGRDELQDTMHFDYLGDPERVHR
jgi:hypothetical protein